MLVTYKRRQFLPKVQVFSVRMYVTPRTLLRDERHGWPAGAQEGRDAAGAARGRAAPRRRTRHRPGDGRGDRRRGDGVPPDVLELLLQQGGGALPRPPGVGAAARR